MNPQHLHALNAHQLSSHLMNLRYAGVFVIGIFIGFLGGLFGKGGSAIATPLLALIGIPGFIAVAAPLPATIPGTFVASLRYWKLKLLDWNIVWLTVAVGVPATIAGSMLTKYTGPTPLLMITGVMVLGFGLNFLFARGDKKISSPDNQDEELPRPAQWRLRLVLVALFVGLTSGLLGNSGGFLLAPAFVSFLRLPIKRAFACSLMVSVFLALPGTIVHTALGHIDWMVTLMLALGSVPFSYLGAKVATKTNSARLEKWYGLVLTALGIFFFLQLL